MTFVSGIAYCQQITPSNCSFNFPTSRTIISGMKFSKLNFVADDQIKLVTHAALLSPLPHHHSSFFPRLWWSKGVTHIKMMKNTPLIFLWFYDHVYYKISRQMQGCNNSNIMNLPQACCPYDTLLLHCSQVFSTILPLHYVYDEQNKVVFGEWM